LLSSSYSGRLLSCVGPVLDVGFNASRGVCPNEITSSILTCDLTPTVSHSVLITRPHYLFRFGTYPISNEASQSGASDTATSSSAKSSTRYSNSMSKSESLISCIPEFSLLCYALFVPLWAQPSNSSQSFRTPFDLLQSEIHSFQFSTSLSVAGYSAVFSLLSCYSNYVPAELAIISKGGISRAISLAPNEGLSVSSSIVICTFQACITPVGTSTLGRIMNVVGGSLDQFYDIRPAALQSPSTTQCIKHAYPASDENALKPPPSADMATVAAHGVGKPLHVRAIRSNETTMSVRILEGLIGC